MLKETYLTLVAISFTFSLSHLACTADDSDDNEADTELEGTAILDIDACIDFCTLQWECVGIKDQTAHPLYDCKEMCGVSVPFASCILPTLPSECKSASIALYQCQYSITSCADFESYMEGVALLIDDDDATMIDDYICGAEYSPFFNECGEDFEHHLVPAETVCKEEMAALEEWTESVWPE